MYSIELCYSDNYSDYVTLQFVSMQDVFNFLKSIDFQVNSIVVTIKFINK